jgi:hypothetical protein
MTQRFVDLPGLYPSKVDANIVSCARVEQSEHGAYVVVHTSQGFAFAVNPTNDQSVNDVYKEVLAVLWPEKTRRTTK